MLAQRSFTVRPHLPGPLRALERLAGNLRWSWDRPTQELFRTIDPAHWESGRHDPRRVLAEAPPGRLDELAGHADFLNRLADVDRSLQDYLDQPRWFGRELAGGRLATSPDGTCALEHHHVAYFSPEFGISEAIPQYSGGLGVLAGDHAKAASDLGVPLVAVGLLYRNGYFRQSLSVDGWQQERFSDLDPHALALEPCEGLHIEVEMAGEPMGVQVWRARVGRVPLYLLDADVPENPRELQLVTDRLYGGDTEHRLRQEILLGIGGIKALDALGVPVRVCHTNEGHAGFLGLERIRVLMQRDGLDFAAALEEVRAGSVFTTHTPVPAGIDRFPRALIQKYLGGWAVACGVEIDELMALGHRPDDRPEDRFNMAVMGMHLAGRRNGVSRMHGSVSRSMFAPLWQGVPEAEAPITHITNGVHGETWVGTEMHDLLCRSLGSDWQWDPAVWERIGTVEPSRLAGAKAAARERLVHHVRRRMRAAGAAAGRSPSDLEWVDRALHPEALTICFARRMAAHKRAALLLSQPDRLRALLADDRGPVQFVFAGKAHPADDRGKEMIRRLVTFSHQPEVRHRFVFVEDYDMALARSLVQGADVWLNTPLRPLEASGTSGMKAVLNGALHCSILDGWWAESFSAGTDREDGLPNGWAISSAESAADEERRSQMEADSLFELLETQAVPLFHERDDSGARAAWQARVQESLRTLGPMVGAHRMVQDYVARMYLPAAAQVAALGTHGHRGATDLADFRRRLATLWPGVRVEEVTADEGVGDLGACREVEATVVLGDLIPDEVQVQLVTGRVGQAGELEDPEVSTMTPSADLGDGRRRYQGEAPLREAGRMGVTVRVVPHHPLVDSPLELGRVAWAG